jgi:hypothetical protein
MGVIFNLTKVVLRYIDGGLRGSVCRFLILWLLIYFGGNALPLFEPSLLIYYCKN